MARLKGYLYNIPRFYQWQTFDHICFGYVTACRRVLPSMTISDAIRDFLDIFGLCEDVYCFDNAKAAYYRIASSLAEKDMGFDPEIKIEKPP